MAGYSTTPLINKLGLKAGMQACFLGMPESVRMVLEPLPEGVVLRRLGKGLDYVHYFAETAADLEAAMSGLKGAIKKEGTIWVSWRKGRKEFSENDVRHLVLAAGLVDVKVCAVDEEWSGLKLVYRLKDR